MVAEMVVSVIQNSCYRTLIPAVACVKLLTECPTIIADTGSSVERVDIVRQLVVPPAAWFRVPAAGRGSGVVRGQCHRCGAPQLLRHRYHTG